MTSNEKSFMKNSI